MSEYFHVTPANDLLPHNTDDGTCLCEPKIDAEGLMVVHNAWDNREFDEIAEAISNE